MSSSDTADRSAESHEFNIALPNLIAILGDALYSTWEVAIRELVQNAHDAIQRMDPPNKTPRIVVDCNLEKRILTIEDSGEGMTKRQAMDQLSTIGEGASMDYRNQLRQSGRREGANRIIGQFGIGLLASFLLGEQVEIESRSAHAEPDKGIRWRSRGGSGYTIEHIGRQQIGTKVTVRLGVGVADEVSARLPVQHRRALALDALKEPEALERVVKRYCELLPVPIYSRNMQMNQTELPWETENQHDACKQFLEQRFGERVDFAIPISENGCRGLAGGTLFVPFSSRSPAPLGNRVDLFLQRMYIGDKFVDILPDWARFFSGVINAWGLRPTLDRDDVQRDPAFFHVRQLLSTAIKNALLKLSAENPAIFRDFVRTHSTTLKKHLADTPRELAESMVPELTFETVSGGIYSLQEILRGQKPHDETTILYFDEPDQRNIVKELLEDVVGDVSFVVVARSPEDERHLQACARINKSIRLQKYIVEVSKILPPVKGPKWQGLEKRASGYVRIPVQVCSLRNPAIPGLLLRSQMEMPQKTITDGLLGQHSASQAIESRLAEVDPHSSVQESLFLNSNCDLIQTLSKRLDDGESDTLVSKSLELVIHAILNVSRLVSGEGITPGEAFRIFSDLRDLGVHLFRLTDREVGKSDRRVRELIDDYESYLHERKRQAAILGILAPPYIPMEIEKIEKNIQELKRELKAKET